ncbi:MAG TPA: GNAT family N-acetyltransferase [Saprospiraceae bacterium]|nr:GNAT family N-acetyltransferase [Saprospiraceae bacterium]
MTIREALITDLDTLGELFDQYRIFYEKPSDRNGARNFIRERIQLSDSKIFVADLRMKALAGFIQLYPLYSSTRMKRLWLLNDLYVLPEQRGLGISVLLIEKAKELARDTHAAGLMLETARDNIIGNNLYVKTGFKEDSDFIHYYWDVD